MLRFHCKSRGGLKKVEEEEDGEEGEDAWESLRCCRVNGALLSREPFSSFPEVPVPTLPPPNTVFLPHTQKTRKHTYFVHVSHNLFSLYHTLSLSPSLFCLIPLGVSPHTLLCLHFPLVSHKHTWPVPPPAHPQLLIISPHLCDCHATQTVKAKKDAIFSFAPPLSYPMLSYPKHSVSKMFM